MEVDVVAAGGSLWIEVKAHQEFGNGSNRATGALACAGLLSASSTALLVAKQDC